jgi:TctA family transporter
LHSVDFFLSLIASLPLNLPLNFSSPLITLGSLFLSSVFGGGDAFEAKPISPEATPIITAAGIPMKTRRGRAVSAMKIEAVSCLLRAGCIFFRLLRCFWMKRQVFFADEDFRRFRLFFVAIGFLLH